MVLWVVQSSWVLGDTWREVCHSMAVLVEYLIEYVINIYLGIDLAWMVTAQAWIEKTGAVFDFLWRS